MSVIKRRKKAVEAAAVVETPVEEAKPKRRGRPPKAKPVIEAVAAPTEAPKKRGRPKKVVAAPVVEAPKAEVAKPKRGRKPKVQSAVEAAPAPAPKKRGRKPKAKPVEETVAEAPKVRKLKKVVAAVSNGHSNGSSNGSNGSNGHLVGIQEFSEFSNKEQAILKRLAVSKTGYNLNELAQEVYPELTKQQASLSLRNSLRRPRKAGWVERLTRGVYRVDPKRVKKVPAEAKG